MSNIKRHVEDRAEAEGGEPGFCDACDTWTVIDPDNGLCAKCVDTWFGDFTGDVPSGRRTEIVILGEPPE